MKDLWQRVFQARPRGVFVIIDPRVGIVDGTNERGQLRALPMILELGISNFTFVDTWSSYRLVDFKYLKFGAELPNKSVFPICQFISQDTELNSDLEITKHLLNSALAAVGSTLVLVVDSAKFCLKDNQDGKPMIEDWDLSNYAFEYERIFSDFLKIIGIDSAISLTQTKNLVFHRMAQLHLQVLDEKPKRMATLFEYQRIPSKSYAWEILKAFANKKAQMECHPYVHQCLRPWVENDITRIADNIIEALQRCLFDPKKVEKLRMERKKEEKVEEYDSFRKNSS